MLIELIMRQVKLNNGISITEMILKVMSHVSPTKYSPQDYQLALEGLISAGEIKRLNFTDPDSPTGTKSILFLKNTTFLNLSEFSDDLVKETRISSQTTMAGESGSDI